MDLQLRGKRALVTGSTTGIGAAIASRLASEGAFVVIHGRRYQQALSLLMQIRNSGGHGAIAIGDLDCDESAADVVTQSLNAFGGIDILINNVGRYYSRPWQTDTANDWNAIYNSNVASMVRMSRHLVPQMAVVGWGRVINIASNIALMPDTNMASYAATKAAVLNMTVALAGEVGLQGVTVNSISPGIIKTAPVEQMLIELTRSSKEQMEPLDLERIAIHTLASSSRVHRLGRPEDVANLVAFVASPLASYINGSNIRVDGGLNPTIS